MHGPLTSTRKRRRLLHSEGAWNEPWSVGLRTGGILPGDRALLLRQKRERNIVASGVFTSELETDEHWDGSGQPTMYARQSRNN